MTPFVIDLRAEVQNEAPAGVAVQECAASLDEIGGKALNLFRLSKTGFTVPDGFVITTAGYRRFVEDNALQELVQAELATADLTNIAELERVSDRLRSSFRQGELRPELRRGIAEALDRLTGTVRPGPGRLTPEPAAVAVAVRSSATAEDLPGLSFAGQQDSYLNVIGLDAVWSHVIECWSSLWTARAIGYRQAHGVDHRAAALAVVVQRLVPADVSGVLFTANPVTGVRAETVVDATVGLGEALVSGQVDPDHFVLDAHGRVLRATAGAKAVRTRTSPGGGVQTTTETASHELSLSSTQLGQLAGLAARIEAEFDAPQDVEWAFAAGTLWVLQSRAITSLFDVPVSYADATHAAHAADAAGGAVTSDSFQVWLSFGAVQGVLVPITPLGRDLLAHLAAGATALGGRPRQVQELAFFGVAHERIFLRIDGLIRHPIGRHLVVRMIGLGEPGSAERIRELTTDPRLQPTPLHPAPLLRGLRHLAPRVVPRLFLALSRPEHARQLLDRTADALLQEAAARQAAADRLADPQRRLHARIAAARAGTLSGLRTLLPAFGPLLAPCVLMLRGVQRMVAGASDVADRQLPLQLLRGLPGNVTTEMDLRLWQVATAIRDTGEADDLLAANPAELADRYHRQTLPRHTQSALTSFLDAYGMRGVAEIDVGRPRWREDPSGVLATLRSYLQLNDPALAPAVVYARGVADAGHAATRLAQLVGPIRKPFVLFAVRRLRALLGARETPKFTMVRVLGMIRAGLLESASELVAQGVLSDPTDMAYLTCRSWTLCRSRTVARRPPAPNDDGIWRNW